MGFTKEEHQIIGKELNEARRIFSNVHSKLAEEYGTSNSVAKKAYTLFEKISKLRSDLDNLAAQELGSDFQPSIYYGKHNH